MSSYSCTGRTNYVLVKDIEAFKAWVNAIDGVTLEERGDLVALVLPDGCPSARTYDEVINGSNTFDLIEEFAEQLQDGEVLVYMETGYEETRYIAGQAIAINNKGQTRSVDLTQIYNLAEDLGDIITRAEY